MPNGAPCGVVVIDLFVIDFFLHRYDDEQISWNVGTRAGLGNGGCRAIVGDSFDRAAVRGGVRFSNAWVDFLYVRDRSRSSGETCERYFVGHGSTDCWREAAGVRCITGGAACDGQSFPKISQWSMWVAT